jgi:hypothetical protein
MHWFWRVLVATVVACLYGGLTVALQRGYHARVQDAVEAILRRRAGLAGGAGFTMGVAIAVAWLLPIVGLAFIVYGVLTRLAGPSLPRDPETRCRRCNYILRGLSEPRCPECGERI